MYSNKLVACVKANGKPLREKGEQVFLPFGSEYTLWFKNEHTRKVQISVEIDGTDVLFDKALLLGPGETMDLKGFVRETYDSEENRAFRFIEKTEQISDYRGDKIEDGLIKITYQFEKERPNPFDYLVRPAVEHHHHHHHNNNHYYPRRNDFWYDNQPYCSSDSDGMRAKSAGTTRGATFSSETLGMATPSSAEASDSGNSMFGGDINCSVASDSFDGSVNCSDTLDLSMDTSFNDAGITVEGSATGQSFQRGHIGTLESKEYTMILQLKGIDKNMEVSKPVTVQLKKKCPTCGKKWKSSFEYCPNDGTYLRK